MMRSFLAAAVILLSALSLSAETGADNVARVKAMVAAINERDLQALDAVVAGDVKRHSAATPGVVVENLAQFKSFLETDFASVPDSVVTINIIFTAGDKVAVHATYSGTQTGTFGPFPASGEYFELPFISILRIDDGKIAEIWVEWDNLSALAQMGHFPPPDADTTEEHVDEGE